MGWLHFVLSHFSFVQCFSISNSRVVYYIYRPYRSITQYSYVLIYYMYVYFLTSCMKSIDKSMIRQYAYVICTLVLEFLKQ